jgi:methylated-DNA-[protein]-cysteine S-methyltransferase
MIATIDRGDGLFDGLTPDSADLLSHLHSRLAADAQAAGLLDVAYRTLDTPVGTLLLAATPAGLVRVAYPNEDHVAVLATLAQRVSPRILAAPARLDAAANEIDEYFAGARTHFDLPLDLQLTDGFRRQVIQHLRDIGYGCRESYAAVAAAVGNPRAVRAVGSACSHNPLPVVIPCHRVVRSDGTIGQYVGGIEAKNTLLTLEAA